jgi:hypothetical protein
MKDYLYLNKNELFTIANCLLEKANSDIWKKLVNYKLDLL